jgi:hypothetical protein
VIVTTCTWDPVRGWSSPIPQPDSHADGQADGQADGRSSLVLVTADEFAVRAAASLGDDPLGELAQAWRGHPMLGWSSAGQAIGARTFDKALVLTIIRFEQTTTRSVHFDLTEAGTPRRAGREIAERLNDPQLRLITLTMDGLTGAGSAIAAGIADVLPDVDVVGALAADGDRFERCWTLVDGRPQQGHVSAVGLIGDHLRVGHASAGGWTTVGPERLVTRSFGNVLHELDGRPAAGVYEEYLGPLATELPASASLRPLQIRDLDDNLLCRTPLRVHDDGSLTMSGDVAQGTMATLLRSSADGLIHATAIAAKEARLNGDQLVLGLGGYGRRRALGTRIEEELEALVAAFDDDVNDAPAVVTSWTYGALSPTEHGVDVHDQTMTITTLSESRP